MNGPTLSFALREMRAHLGAPVVVAIQAGVAVVLAIAAPFGTDAGLGLGLRLIYWAGIVFGTYGLGTAMTLLVVDRLDRASSMPAAIRVLRAGGVVGVAGLGFVLLWSFIFFGPPALNWAGLGSTAAGVFLVAWVVMGVRAAVMRPAPAQPDAPALLRRLPMEKRGALIALTATDHYVQVTTTQGSALILMRLADAMTETAPVDGMQVHRSHWVALDQVRAARRRGDGAVLQMENGLEIPVSRRHMGSIREAGLLPSAAPPTES